MISISRSSFDGRDSERHQVRQRVVIARELERIRRHAGLAGTGLPASVCAPGVRTKQTFGSALHLLAVLLQGLDEQRSGVLLLVGDDDDLLDVLPLAPHVLEGHAARGAAARGDAPQGLLPRRPGRCRPARSGTPSCRRRRRTVASRRSPRSWRRSACPARSPASIEPDLSIKQSRRPVDPALGLDLRVGDLLQLACGRRPTGRPPSWPPRP